MEGSHGLAGCRERIGQCGVGHLPVRFLAEHMSRGAFFNMQKGGRFPTPAASDLGA